MIARLAILAALWSPLIAACCHPTVIRRPVVVVPPSCLPGPAPLPPVGVAPLSAAWAQWYALELTPWIVEVEASCAAPSSDEAPSVSGAYGETVR